MNKSAYLLLSRDQVKSVAITLLFCVSGLFSAFGQTTVQVDSTKSWLGYMNVYNVAAGPSQGSYVFGQAWGTGALTAFFTGTSTATMMPNTNVWNANDAFWVNNGQGNKWMEANFYVDVGNSFGGQSVTFTGMVLSNTLVSPYTCVAVIKEFAPGYAFIGQTTVALTTGTQFTVTRPIGAGNICQYGFMTLGPDANPATVASLGKVVVQVNNADPSLSTMASHAVVEGQSVSFTATVQGTAPLSYQWTHISPTSTNVLSNGGTISGANTNTLTISSTAVSDAGTYILTVTNTHGTNTAIASLTIIPLSQAMTNYLIDPSVEIGFAGNSSAGWSGFNGAVTASTNDYYFASSTHVNVLDGTNTAQIYSSGPNTYNGIFQDRPASAGEVYVAGAWFYTPSDDSIGGSNVCYLEVQFRDAGGAVLRQCSSAQITSTSPWDTWMYLTPTNIKAGDFVTSLGSAPYMVAPPNTASVRFQVTYYAAPSPNVGGSVYVDSALLQIKEPVLAASRNGANVQLSFPTHYGPTYQAFYKTNLLESTWHALPSGSVVGNGNTRTINDSAANPLRIYTVNTQ